jgi:hypothetical protein
MAGLKKSANGSVTVWVNRKSEIETRSSGKIGIKMEVRKSNT